VNALSGASTLAATSGKAIANSGLINVENGATLTLSGKVINSGTIQVSATSSATALDLEHAKIPGVATPFQKRCHFRCNAVSIVRKVGSEQFGRRSRPAGRCVSTTAAVLDGNLDLVALK
jgi:hypothetical protein